MVLGPADLGLIRGLDRSRRGYCGSHVQAMHNPSHHPEIIMRPDRRLMVSCVQCQKAGTDLPIGIGIPLSKQVAEMLRETTAAFPPVATSLRLVNVFSSGAGIWLL